MTGPTHTASPFDSGSDALPAALEVGCLPNGGAGRVVAFVCEGDEGYREWGADAVVEVAQRWAELGVRVFLADLDLEDPRLHKVLGVENGEGIADAFRFGASVQRIANRVGRSPFFFAPAGTPIGDSTEVFAHPRWDVLVQGFDEAGAALVLFVPEDIAASAEVLAKATDVVWMGSSDPEGRLGASAGVLLGWLSPADPIESTPVPESVDHGSGAEAEEHEAVEAVRAAGSEDEGEASWEAVLDETASLETLGDEGGVSEEAQASVNQGVVAAPRRRRRQSRPWLVRSGIAAVLLLGAFQLWNMGLLPFGNDGAGGAGGQPEDMDPAELPVAAESGPEATPTEPLTADPVADLGSPTAPVLGYSLVVGSTPNADDARALAGRLSEAMGDLLFVVAPSAVNGGVWYRTLAGPAVDASGIPGIRERVAASGIVGGSSDWFGRRTELAFSLGEFGSIEEADGRSRALGVAGIPAYVLQVDYEGGVRYRVYAGGYATADEAEPLRAALDETGEDAELIRRIGRLPGAP